MPSFAPPADNPRIKVVRSFDELISTPLVDGVNALCWPRTLAGDFAEVAGRLDLGPGITTLDEAMLEGLAVSVDGRTAIEAMLEDQRVLRAVGLDPVLDCVNGYTTHDLTKVVRTDVCSFHVDTAMDEADTWLCTYHGLSSEGLRNEQAQRRVEIPETRAALLRLYGGEDGEAFEDYLAENFYDLHYAARPGAVPFSFGVGNLWRIAIDYPGSPVPPCIHRAPDPIAGERRLLLIS